MSIDFDEIKALQADNDDQVEWWHKHGDDLGAEGRDEIFDFIVDGGIWTYLHLLIELTLSNLDRPDRLTEDLERLSPHIDGDLAWGMLYDEYRDRLDDRHDLANAIYQRLISKDDEWLTWMAGVALGHQAEDTAHEELLTLLSSDANNEVRAGIQAVIEQYQNQQVPDAHVEAFASIVDRDILALTQEVLRANAVLFTENDDLWKLTLRIGRSNPETVPFIAQRFGPEVKEPQLPAFLGLLKQGLEAGQSVGTSQVSYFLHSRFSDQSEILADYIIDLSDYDLYEAGRLAKEITKENPAFQSYLNDRRGNFQNEFIADRILTETREFVDEGISELARLLEAAFEEENPQTKGDLLEDAAEHLIDLVDAFEFARNVTANEEEIDIMVHNHFDTHIQRWGTPILVECRNRADPVQAKHIRDFEGKLWNRNADTGFLISRSGFTGGTEDQIIKSREPGREKMIGMVEMDELLELTESDEIISLLLAKYNEINEL